MRTPLVSFYAVFLLFLAFGEVSTAEQIVITSPSNGAVFQISPENTTRSITIQCQVTGLQSGVDYGWAYRLDGVWSANPPFNVHYPLPSDMFTFDVSVGAGPHQLRVVLYWFNWGDYLWYPASSADVSFSCIQTYRITVENSFGAGTVKVDGQTYASGAQFIWPANSSHTLEAISGQTTNRGGFPHTWDYFEWRKNGGSPTTTNPLVINVTENATYRAEFTGQITISGTHTIQSGQEGIIEPRTEVRFEPGAKLTVYGKLTANGTAPNRITFTRSGSSGDWLGIEFSGSGAHNSSLQYCDIHYATMPIKATNTSNLTISNVTIGNSSFYNGSDNAAMAFYNSSPTISNVTINGQSNSQNGIRFAQGSAGGVSGCTIQNLGLGNGIVVQGGSDPTITGNIEKSPGVTRAAFLFSAR